MVPLTDHLPADEVIRLARRLINESAVRALSSRNDGYATYHRGLAAGKGLAAELLLRFLAQHGIVLDEDPATRSEPAPAPPLDSIGGGLWQ